MISPDESAPPEAVYFVRDNGIGIKDKHLAAGAADIEGRDNLTAKESRAQMRALIEQCGDHRLAIVHQGAYA